MQTLVHVYCTRGKSLREQVANDNHLDRHFLQVVREQKPGRRPGWLKVRSTESNRRGAINVQWDTAGVLRCRVVNRGAGKPNLILGDFLDYLLARFRKRLRSIIVVPGD